jgi:hypothetical protein
MEAVLEHGSGTQVAQLGLDKGAQVAGRAVLDGEYGVQIIVVLDDHAGTQLGGRDRHCLETSPCKSMRFAEQAKGGTSHISAAQEDRNNDSTTGGGEKENPDGRFCPTRRRVIRSTHRSFLQNRLASVGSGQQFIEGRFFPQVLQ